MPIGGAAVMGIGSLLSGLLSAIGVGKDQGGATQINPLTDAYYQDLLSQIAQASAAQQQGINTSQTAQGNMNRLAGDMSNTVGDINNLQQPGAMDWFDNFLSAVPEYQNIAEQAGQRFTETAGRSIQEQARLNTAKAVSDTAAQFAGQNAFSGAANAAVGQAVAQPMADATAALTSKQADIGSNTFNQLSNTGQQQAFQGTQNEFNNALQVLVSALGGQQAEANTYGNVANVGLNEAQIAASQASQLRAAQADVAQPIWQQNAGSDPFAMISQLLSGGAGVSNMIGPNTNMGNGNMGNWLQDIFSRSGGKPNSYWSNNDADWTT